MAGTATMVVVWGNILSLIGNAFAQAVEILVFDAFFHSQREFKKSLAYILLWWGISTFSAIAIGTKFGIYVQDASGNCVPVHILCFPIPKPMGPKILHRCNHLCCFILLQSLV